MYVTVAIEGPNNWKHFAELEAFVGHGRLYFKGTDEAYFVDFPDRPSADLAVNNLNLMPDVKARILPMRG